MGRMEDSIAAHLFPGERLVATRGVAPAGALGHGLISSMVASDGVKASDLSLLAITDHRVLFCKTRRGKVVAVLRAVPNDHIGAMEAERAKVAFGKLRLHLRDGGTVELDLRSDRDLEAFLTSTLPLFAAASGPAPSAPADLPHAG